MTRSRSWLSQRLPLAGDADEVPDPSSVAVAAPQGRTTPQRDDVTGAPTSPPVVDDVAPTTEAPAIVAPPADDGPSTRVQPTVDDPDAPGRGDAPTPARPSRRERRKQWRQEDRARRYAARRSVRFPIFTRSVLLWMTLFALFGLAFGASGAFWWAHFNTQVAELREETRDIEARSQEALAQIEAERNAAVTQINQSLEPLAGFLSEANTIRFAELFAPSVWFVATLDEDGQPSVGSAFAVSSTPESTLMVTSFGAVKAASVEPGPTIEVSKGTEDLEARLVNFDADRDLALLEVPRGDIPVMEWATDDQQANALGSRVFPVSGFGGAGASLTSGIVIDQSAAGFVYDAPTGPFMQGGPIVTADGKVLGITTLQYRPFGFPYGDVSISPHVNQLCDKLIDCGGGARTRPAPDAPPIDPATPGGG